MKKSVPAILFFLLIVRFLPAQIQIEAESFSVGGTGDRTAFWIQNNRYGILGQQSFQENIDLSVVKKINPAKKFFDVGAGAQIYTGLSDSGFQFIPLEYYIEGKLWIFDAIIGAKKQHFGLQDEALSSGGLILSQNARPIPGITAGIFDFTTIPYTFNFVEIKGLIKHGWFIDDAYGKGLLLHQKSAVLRIGGKLPVKLSYGLDHVAQWGGTIPKIGEQKVNWENFYRIFLGKSGGEDANMSDQINALGNHIISQNLNLEFSLGDWKAAAYWQNISEDGPIRWEWLSMNRRDGLWGMWVRNKNFPVVKGLTLEYICTLDQSGPWHDKDGIVFGGDDSYFKNFFDWTFYNRTIGNSFILSPGYNIPFSNRITYNALRAYHLGVDGAFGNYKYRLLASQVRYYPQMKPDYKDHFFGMLEVSRSFNFRFPLEVGLTAAGDAGALTGNNFSLMLQVKVRNNK
jgi:hypothetical protein